MLSLHLKNTDYNLAMNLHITLIINKIKIGEKIFSRR